MYVSTITCKTCKIQLLALFQSDIGSGLFMTSLTCYVGVFLQLAPTFIWGNEITLESANVGKVVMEIDYVGTPKSFQKSLVLLMARSQRPVVVTAGKFVNLSLETLVTVSNCTSKVP